MCYPVSQPYLEVSRSSLTEFRQTRFDAKIFFDKSILVSIELSINPMDFAISVMLETDISDISFT